MRQFDRKIVLEDGSEYPGFSFGSREDRVCEIVFNTSMAGYQEIVSDLSYTGQMVVINVLIPSDMFADRRIADRSAAASIAASCRSS